MTMMLQELEQSGFISAYIPFGKKKKDTLFRLTDCYSLFYLKFIKDIPIQETITWKSVSQTQTWITWSGYAFENICLKHIPQIKKALSIGGVYATASSFSKKGSKSEKGTQIDLLLDRNDSVITIFEIKFYNQVFTLTKDYAQNLKSKLDLFQIATQTKKQLFLVLITAFGLNSNEHSLGLVEKVLTGDDLFLE
jgi:hypothetical protein